MINLIKSIAFISLIEHQSHHLIETRLEFKHQWFLSLLGPLSVISPLSYKCCQYPSGLFVVIYYRTLPLIHNFSTLNIKGCIRACFCCVKQARILNRSIYYSNIFSCNNNQSTVWSTFTKVRILQYILIVLLDNYIRKYRDRYALGKVIFLCLFIYVKTLTASCILRLYSWRTILQVIVFSILSLIKHDCIQWKLYNLL